ncbi:CGNR zinc finger domain-containing protein [Agrococcus sp. SGAir0287]|uniref:CGNR zinc finger domain-containing protein n=1 Tax=Agrococcus sp. SGAir0287 TaxID=2070347 RepID=UPI0010CCF547|nr:CGNR zinc finger domain-containing protein [Agrococcus sp. SGAir0287]QCR20040.1 RNA-binding protein [Agrococcus sp. SGAir0287]
MVTPLRLPTETVAALEAVVAIATAANAGALDDAAGLDAALGDIRYTGSRAHDDAEAREVRDVVPALLAMWDAERDDVPALANAILRGADAAPQLVRHDGIDWHLHAIDPERPLAERIAVETAIAFVDLIRLDETDRCKRCAAGDCGLPMLDLSRNRSRRFCSTACQSRVNVAAYRARSR